METAHTTAAGHDSWLERIGEVELIGGWAEVLLDDEFAASTQAGGYQVFVTAYDPVQLFVQNRAARSFEIHVLPRPEARRPVTTRCAYRAVGRAAERAIFGDPGDAARS